MAKICVAAAAPPTIVTTNVWRTRADERSSGSLKVLAPASGRDCTQPGGIASTQVCPIAHVKARSCHPECAEHEGDCMFNTCRSHHVHSTSTRARTFDRQSCPCCFQSCAVDCSASRTAITNSWTISAALWSCMASAAARLQLTRLYRAAKRAWWRLATGGLHFCKRARVGSQGPLESRLEPNVPPCGRVSSLCSCVLLEPPVR